MLNGKKIGLASSLEIHPSCGGEAETAALGDDKVRVLRIERVAAKEILLGRGNTGEGKDGGSKEIKKGMTASNESTVVQWRW